MRPESFPGQGQRLGGAPVRPPDLISQDPSLIGLRAMTNSDIHLLQLLQGVSSQPSQGSAPKPIEIGAVPVPKEPIRPIPPQTPYESPFAPSHTAVQPATCQIQTVNLPTSTPNFNPALFPGLTLVEKNKPVVLDSEIAGESQLENGLSVSFRRHGGALVVESWELEGLSESQAGAIKAILEGKNILLTGPAGTGKSHTIKRLKEIFERRKLKVSITSTTGASAILVEGKTIHSWAGIGICGSKESALKRVMQYKSPQEKIQSTTLLIIDEVSMLSADLIDILDYVFRIIRNSQQPAGGLQLLLCGDFYQLPPVKCSAYAFDSPVWKNLIHEVHELTFIYRQESAAFCKALNEIRIGEISPSTVDLVTKCVGRQFEGEIKPTELYPVNDDVSAVNEDELWKLVTDTNPVREIASLDELIEKKGKKKSHPPKFLEECKARLNKDCVAPEFLQLVIGAQVMLIKNLNVEAGLANGSRGVVVGFSNYGQPTVKFLNGQVLTLGTVMWYMRVNETTKIRRTQFPLRLAWATTIHKAQGCTIDLLKIDLGSKIFAEGQFYTAISRARTLEGLSLIAVDWDRVYVSKKVKAFYASNKK